LLREHTGGARIRLRPRSGKEKTRGAIVTEVNQIAGISLKGNSVIDYIGEKDLAGDPAMLRLDETGQAEYNTIE
jgi:hypothetical protein